MRTCLALLAFAVLAACGGSSPDSASDLKEPLRTYDLTGQVISLDDSGSVKIAKIKHQAIGDWMGAMTMEFPVLDPEQFAKLKPGEEITGKVYVRGLTFWAGDFEPAAPSDAPPGSDAKGGEAAPVPQAPPK